MAYPNKIDIRVIHLSLKHLVTQYVWRPLSHDGHDNTIVVSSTPLGAKDVT